MASRKEQKEQARQRRLAEQQAQAAQARQRRRLQMLGGVVVAAVAIIAVGIAISSGSNTPSGLKRGKQAEQTYAQVNSLLQGIPQSGTTLGSPSAPVTLTYYGDLECPVCRDFTLSSFPQFVTQQVRTGKVKVVYRSFCTATCNGPGQSVFNTQQVAAYAAGKQNLFWDYAELFYHEQGQEGSGYVTSSYLNSLAEQIPNLNLKSWQTDQKDPSLLAQVQGDESSATGLGVQGTPTLIMKGPKGTTPVPATVPTYQQLVSTVKAVS